VRTVTTPTGNPEGSFDLCRLVEAAGATLVARWTTAHPRQITKAVKQALHHRGFAFLEIMSQCPVHYGKLSREGRAVQSLETFRQKAVTRRQAARLAPAELEGRWLVGQLVGDDAGEEG
jgi:2-oxoglutarate ferredoxin oxidoreductase subunit beta